MAQYPNWEIGDLVTADALNLMLPKVYAKSSNSTRTSTTTVSADAELQGIPLDVGTYDILFLGFFNSTGASIGARTQWAFSGTWNTPVRNCSGGNIGSVTTGSATTMNAAGYGVNQNALYDMFSDGAYVAVREHTVQAIVTVAGSLSLQWAQKASSATAATLQAQSSFVIRRCA